MLACPSQIPAIHSSPACDTPSEDDETSASFAFRLKQSWAIHSLDAAIGVFDSSYNVLLPGTYMVMC